jgi:hypothetical protein
MGHLRELDFRPVPSNVRPTNEMGQRRANALAPDTRRNP